MLKLAQKWVSGFLYRTIYWRNSAHNKKDPDTNTCLSEASGVLGAGVEPKKPIFQRGDNSRQKPAISCHNVSEYASNKIDVTCVDLAKEDSLGILSDNESKLIDSLRAQYKHNEISVDLLDVINSWANLPQEIRNSIQLMVSIF